MKRTYEAPMACSEEFIPNEYVAVCWGVYCFVDKANRYEAYINNSAQNHRSEHCGTTGHQWLTDSDGDGTPERMSEIDTDGLGTLACTLYTNDSYSIQRDISTVKSGNYIYWTTSSGNRTWHHQGWVTASTPGHPNRS